MQVAFADGQLAVSATSVYQPGPNDARVVDLVLQNTSGSNTETVLLTISRNGGTSRRLFRRALLPNAQWIIRGVRLEPSDILYGQTTHATTVDYMVTAGGGEFAVESFDANGALLQVNGTSVSGAISGDSLAVTNGITGASLQTTAGITSTGPTGAGIGYATGAGGTVTQGTSRSTGVTLSKLCGQITTHDASLAAGAEVQFTVTNTTVAATDFVGVNITPGGTGTPQAYVSNVADGSFKITLTNLHASTADTSADVINFVVVKGVAA